MKVCVVGHGRSLKDAKLGKKIDACDKVVRLKGADKVLWTDDFGSKTDALCGSTEVMGNFLNMERKGGVQEYWGYPKNGDFDIKVAMKVLLKLQKPLMIPLAFSNNWRSRFQQMGSTFPNVSTGTAAILFTIHRWEPETILLAGFDTVMNPKIRFARHEDVPRSTKDSTKPFPPHDWATENKLLKKLEEIYNMEIKDICSRNI